MEVFSDHPLSFVFDKDVSLPVALVVCARHEPDVADFVVPVVVDAVCVQACVVPPVKRERVPNEVFGAGEPALDSSASVLRVWARPAHASRPHGEEAVGQALDMFGRDSEPAVKSAASLVCDAARASHTARRFAALQVAPIDDVLRPAVSALATVVPAVAAADESAFDAKHKPVANVVAFSVVMASRPTLAASSHVSSPHRIKWSGVTPTPPIRIVRLRPW